MASYHEHGPFRAASGSVLATGRITVASRLPELDQLTAPAGQPAHPTPAQQCEV
jgi:hypothetical protein